MECRINIKTLFAEMTMDQLVQIRNFVDDLMETKRQIEFFRLYERGGTAWSGVSETVKEPPATLTTAKPNQKKVNPLYTQEFKYDSLDKPYVKVCLKPSCPCRYYAQSDTVSAHVLKHVDAKSLFVHGFDQDKTFEEGRREVFMLIKMSCLKLYKDRELCYEYPFDTEDDKSTLWKLCQDALSANEKVVTYKKQKLHLVVDKTAPLPEHIKVIPNERFGFCTFESHEKAARAQVILTSWGFVCNFLVQKTSE